MHASTDPSLEAKAIQKEKIFQAFKEGRLGFRDITLKYEKNYLANNKKNPRPIYLVLHDTPINMRSKVNNQTIGIINPTTLACYKDKRSVTNDLQNNDRLDGIDGKFLADKNTLIIKMKEKADRNWEVYNISTSGHLDEYNEFTLPKFKENSNNQDYVTIKEPEIITTGYATKDIACYCIHKYDHRAISQILAKKHNLEQSLEIKTPLPLVLYDENKGSLEIFYEEEINNYLDTLTFNERQLDEFSYGFKTPFNIINELINTLPFIHRLNILGTTKLDMSSGGCPPKSEIINLVSCPENYNIKKLKELLRQDATINIQVKHGSEYISLIDKLIRTEADRCLIYLRYQNNPIKYQQGTIEFFALFNELALQRCSMCETSLYCLTSLNLDYFSTLFNNAIAFGLPIYESFVKDLLNKSIEGDHFSIVALDHALTRMTDEKRANIMDKNFNNKKQQIFMILFYYGVNPTKYPYFLRKLETNEYPEDVESINDIIYMWNTRKSNPYYISWPHKLTEANKTVDKLRQELGIFDKNPITNTQISDGEQKLIQLLIAEFNKPPAFNTIENNDETVTTLLQYYYYRPSEAQLLKALSTGSLPKIYGSIGLSSAVLRTNHNVAWYTELLEKFNLATFTEEEKTLLRLAILYNHVATGGIANQQEPQKAAEFFRRDMLNYFPAELIEIIATVVSQNKNATSDINTTSRLYLEVLHVADKIEFTNSVDFEDILPSNSLYLTLTAKQKILFQQNLNSAISGAKDLAIITGGMPNNKQEKTPYATKYKLNINNERQQQAFKHTQTPLTHINTALDNNVRRKIALLAGIETCTDKEHKTCNPDITNGVMYGIHSNWNDLQQIYVPSCMTTLEKIQFEHDPTLLNENTLDIINTEVNKLKTEGIKMNLGVLTQDALIEDEVQEILKKHYIKVITEHRLRGYDHLGNPQYEEVLVPVNIFHTQIASILNKTLFKDK